LAIEVSEFECLENLDKEEIKIIEESIEK